MDKLQDIEERYILNNKWAWSSYINLVEKNHLSWLIQHVKLLRKTRLIQGSLIIDQTQELKKDNESIEQLTSEVRNLKSKTRFKVYEENLRLALENKKLKDMLSQCGQEIEIKEWTDF